MAVLHVSLKIAMTNTSSVDEVTIKRNVNTDASHKVHNVHIIHVFISDRVEERETSFVLPLVCIPPSSLYFRLMVH